MLFYASALLILNVQVTSRLSNCVNGLVSFNKLKYFLFIKLYRFRHFNCCYRLQAYP